MHGVGPVDHAEHGDGLVGAHHQLEARPLRRRQPLAGGGVTEPAGAEGGLVGLGRDLAVQAEPGGAGAAPPQRRLAPGAVVVERRAGVVVGPADDRRLVVGDLVRAHRAEPRHQADVPGIVQPKVAIVLAIGVRCRIA